MGEGIFTALITGGLSLVGVIISNVMANRKIEQKLEVAQAVTETKIEELTREVRAHNNFAQRMPVVENEIKHLNKEVKHIESDIQKYHG
jgi:alpha-acetolactate decarboxylase